MTNIKVVANNGYNSLQEIEQEREKLKKLVNDDLMTNTMFEYENKKLDANRIAVIENCYNDIDKIENKFYQMQGEKYRLKGEDVTDDIKLFNGSFDLSQAEIDTLTNKYADNKTMTNAINKYSHENGLKFNGSLLDADAENRENYNFGLFKEYAKDSVTDTINHDFINDMYNKCIELSGIDAVGN